MPLTSSGFSRAVGSQKQWLLTSSGFSRAVAPYKWPPTSSGGSGVTVGLAVRACRPLPICQPVGIFLPVGQCRPLRRLSQTRQARRPLSRLWPRVLPCLGVPPSTVSFFRSALTHGAQLAGVGRGPAFFCGSVPAGRSGRGLAGASLQGAGFLGGERRPSGRGCPRPVGVGLGRLVAHARRARPEGKARAGSNWVAVVATGPAMTKRPT